MAETLDFDKTLCAQPYDAVFASTYRGQAHIAGTGPRGATCRQCAYWGSRNAPQEHPGFYSKNSLIKDAYCNYPISGKADRAFPNYASACRFFERADNPHKVSK